jgi:hypothetical protein
MFLDLIKDILYSINFGAVPLNLDCPHNECKSIDFLGVISDSNLNREVNLGTAYSSIGHNLLIFDRPSKRLNMNVGRMPYYGFTCYLLSYDITVW